MTQLQNGIPGTRCVGNMAAAYQRVRQFTQTLCETLVPEDCVIQSMPDVSPIRWHIAHTTWFFETFVLAREPGYRPFNEQYSYLFNSYYNAVGKQFPRPHRGLLSRPTVGEIQEYRYSVDEKMIELLQSDSATSEQLASVVELGLHHEQQHQELMLTDIKHIFSCNPLLPTFRQGCWETVSRRENHEWIGFDEQIYEIGHTGRAFAYDNESPRHRVLLGDFQLSSSPVTCGQYLEFIKDGGYRRAELWLSDGWRRVTEDRWQAPLHWFAPNEDDDVWSEFTLAGPTDIDPARPVCHVSYFEADAYARWAGARLPTEMEWEVAASRSSVVGNFADTLVDQGIAIHPAAAPVGLDRPARMFGDVWEWTASQYLAYPGYRPPAGALGEYNGKFMCNQFVLRGGSCATSGDHIRPTYRNFFPPEARWQFSGFRLAG